MNLNTALQAINCRLLYPCFSHWPQQSLTLSCHLLSGFLRGTELKSSSKSHITLPAWHLSSALCFIHLNSLSEHSDLSHSTLRLRWKHLCVSICAALCGKLLTTLSPQCSCWCSGDGQGDFWRSFPTSAFLWFHLEEWNWPLTQWFSSLDMCC